MTLWAQYHPEAANLNKCFQLSKQFNKKIRNADLDGAFLITE